MKLSSSLGSHDEGFIVDTDFGYHHGTQTIRMP